MNKPQIKQNFIQLCHDNSWNLFINKSNPNRFPLVNDNKEEYILIDSRETKNSIFHKYVNETHLSINDFLDRVDGIQPDKIFLTISKEIEFKIFTNFPTDIAKETLHTIKATGINNFNNWHDFFSTFQLVKSETKDIKQFFKDKTAKFSNSDLPELFNYLEFKKFNKQDQNDILSSFCINHKNKIISNLTARNFLLNKIKNTLPQSYDFYSSLLFVEDTEELFGDPGLKFNNIFLYKSKLVKTFPLIFKNKEYNKDLSADMSDYHNILTSLNTFLNKPKIKQILNFNSAFLMAKQDSKPYYIINIEHTGKINEILIENFIKQSFSYISNFSRVNPTKNIFELKEQTKNVLLPLFNSIILENTLPRRENNKVKIKKI